MNPLDKLTSIIAKLMGKNPDDPYVLEAVVEVVMAIRTPTQAMFEAARHVLDETNLGIHLAWVAMIDALLTEGEG